MRPLLLLAPLGWLLLAEAKGDAKPEGEGAGRARAGGLGCGLLGCTGGLGSRGDLGSGRLASDSLVTRTDHFPCWGCSSHVRPCSLEERDSRGPSHNSSHNSDTNGYCLWSTYYWPAIS